MLSTKKVVILAGLGISLFTQVGCIFSRGEAITFGASALALVGAAAAVVGCGPCGYGAGIAFAVQVVGVISLAELSDLDSTSLTPDQNFSVVAVVNPVRFGLTGDQVGDQTLIAGGKVIDDSRMIKLSLQKYYGAVAAQNTVAAQLQQSATCSAVSALNVDLQTYGTALSDVSAELRATSFASISVTAADVLNLRDQIVRSGSFPANEAQLFREAGVSPNEMNAALAGAATITNQSVTDLGNLTGGVIFQMVAQEISHVNVAGFLPSGFMCPAPSSTITNPDLSNPRQTGNPVYTRSAKLADFTACVVPADPTSGKGGGYAQFILGNLAQGSNLYSMPGYTPTSLILATPGSPRVIGSGGSPPAAVTFAAPVSQILVFPSLDHVGNHSGNGNGSFGWDAYQFSIWTGYWQGNVFYFNTLLFDPISVKETDDPTGQTDPHFTLNSWKGTGPTLVNNALTPGVGFPPGIIGYEQYFDFTGMPNTPNSIYGFFPSTLATNSRAELEQELSAVAACGAPSGFVEVCKVSNASPGVFAFTVKTPGAPSTSIQVVAGACSGPIQVSSGTVNISEILPLPPGVGLTAVTASGYNPTTFVLEPRLVSSNLAAGSAIVTVVPGDVSVETVATFTNQGPSAPGFGQVKICKIAGAGVPVGQNFSFTATGPAISRTYTVPAGPASEGGYCIIDSSPFPVGTKVTVAEVISTLIYTVTSAVSPTGTTGGSSIIATIGTGFTEVTFTNTRGFIVDHTPVIFTGDVFGTPIPFPVLLTSAQPIAFTAGATVTAGPAGWLTVSPAQGTTPATLTVSAAVLPAGSYAGAITITSADGAYTLSIPVTYTVASSGAVSQTISHVADGASWSTSIILVNTGAQPASFTLQFTGDNGTAFAPSLTGLGKLSNVTGTIPVGGSKTISTDGTAPVLSEGWARVTSSQSIDGTAIFRLTSQDSAVQEAAVPLLTAGSSSLLFPFDNNTNLATGIALAAPDNNTNTMVAWRQRNQSGQNLTASPEQPVSLPPFGHTAFVLTPDSLQAANLRGVAQFDSQNGPIFGLGIRSNKGAFTSIEAVTKQPPSTKIISHVADGAAWKTTIILVNTDTVPASFTVNLWQDNGSAFTVQLVGASAQASISGTIPVGGTYTIETADVASQLTTGWAEVLSSQSIGGTAVFRLESSGQEAAVPLLTAGGAKLMLPFDSGSGLALGVALANPSLTQDVNITYTLRDENGNPIPNNPPRSIALPRHQHTSLVLPVTLNGVAGQRGVVEFDSPTGAIFVLGIRSNNGAFTSVRALGK